jgi:hypothetical protein
MILVFKKPTREKSVEKIEKNKEKNGENCQKIFTKIYG